MGVQREQTTKVVAINKDTEWVVPSPVTVKVCVHTAAGTELSSLHCGTLV